MNTHDKAGELLNNLKNLRYETPEWWRSDIDKAIEAIKLLQLIANATDRSVKWDFDICVWNAQEWLESLK